MIRVSKHILKYNTNCKELSLEYLFDDYEDKLNECISMIKEGKLSLRKWLSSKDLPYFYNYKAWNCIVYKNASKILKSLKSTQVKILYKERYKRYKKVYHYFKKENRQIKFLNKRFSELNLKKLDIDLNDVDINLKNIVIDLTGRFYDIQNVTGEFNNFIRIYLPYYQYNKQRSIKINLPIKNYKYMLKYLGKDWKRLDGIKLLKEKNNFYIVFCYEKDFVEKNNGNEIGIDVGYKKLFVDSNNNYYGDDMKELYEKLSKKRRGSKKYKKLLKERDKKINEVCNKLDVKNLKNIYVENLKNVKKNKIGKFINKLQYWSYLKTINKLERLCEENGILMKKVNPAYTSQECSNCGVIDKESRNGEIYHCKNCGIEIDADYNASINILHRGVYNPSNSLS